MWLGHQCPVALPYKHTMALRLMGLAWPSDFLNRALEGDMTCSSALPLPNFEKKDRLLGHGRHLQNNIVANASQEYEYKSEKYGEKVNMLKNRDESNAGEVAEERVSAAKRAFLY